MSAVSFVALGVLMGSHWSHSLPEIAWWVVILTFVAGWAVSGAALRPHGSAVLGAVLGLVAYVASGVGIVVAAALQVGATLDLSYGYLVAIWPGFLIGWLGLFGARWD